MEITAGSEIASAVAMGGIREKWKVSGGADGRLR
jgi:hypothetical protein